jgi:hypothetical protein
MKTKEVDMQNVDNTGTGAKRGLDFNQEKDELMQHSPEGIVGDQNAMVMDKVLVAHPAVGGTIEKDRKKRSKKEGSNSNNFVGSADSSKGSVWSQ